MSEHTQEPWRLGNTSSVVADEPVIGMNGSDAVEYYGGHLICESVVPSNARRIIACVNACAGIGTEWLEKNAAMLQSMVGDIQNISCQLDEAKAHRDELLAERDKLLFHESQLVESLKSYMNKYGPGYSCTDTLAYDNATGVLAAIANAEKPPCA